jgi:hypothetical protein
MSAEDDFKYARDYRRGTPGTWGGDQATRDKHMFDGMITPTVKIQRTPKPPKPAKVRPVKPDKPESPPFRATTVDWVMFAIAWIVSFSVMKSSMGVGSAAAVAFIPGLVGLRFWRHVVVLSVIAFLIWAFVHAK